MIKEKNFSNLIDVYNDTKNDESTFLDSRSIHWKKFNKEKFVTLDNLINFRKNQVLSEGMDDSMNLQNKLNLMEVLDYFDDNFLKKNLPKKNIGNCHNSVNFLGYWFDYGIIHHLKWYEKIESYIQNNFFILEIGGGFGSFARIILNNKNVKYFLIDLPEANLISNYYLQLSFPEKRIFNYSDFKKIGLEKNVENYDIFILPPRILDTKNINYDFIINTRSFMEMNKKIIKEYFDLIQKKIRHNGYFLNINRYMKSTVKEEIRFSDYPYDNFWDKEISEKSFLQPHIHFLLTKRIKESGNIYNELQAIKNSNTQWVNYGNLKFKLMKAYIKRFIWLFTKSLLVSIVGKKKLKKISKVLYGISEQD